MEFVQRSSNLFLLFSAPLVHRLRGNTNALPPKKKRLALIQTSLFNRSNSALPRLAPKFEMSDKGLLGGRRQRCKNDRAHQDEMLA